MLGPKSWSIAALAAVAFTTPAWAQTPSPLPEWEYSAGIPLRSYFLWGHLPKWEYNVGVGTAFEPKYDGASQYHFQTGPSIDIRYRDIAFLSTGEGLGWNFLHARNYRLGVALTYDLGRTEHSDYRLRGVGDVQPGPEIKLFGEYVWFPVVFRADVRRALGGYNGWVGDLSIYAPILGSEKYRYFVLFGPSVTFTDGNYARNYFGISPEQAAKSGYPAFQAFGGVKELSIGTSATWFFRDNWYVNVSGGAGRLLGDAASSPTTNEKLQGVVSFTLGYDFN